MPTSGDAIVFEYRGLSLTVEKGTAFRSDEPRAFLYGLPEGPPWHGPVVSIPGYKDGMTRGKVKQLAIALADQVLAGR